MSREAVRGFILHPTYRLEAGRPVVHLFGRLEDGRSFLVRDRRLSPYFFIRSVDAEAARARGAGRQAPTSLMSMRGDEVARVEVDTPDQTPPLRDALQRAGLPVFEADVRFAMRYLIDRGIRGALDIETASPRGDDDAAGRRRSGSGADHGPYPVEIGRASCRERV